MLVEAQFGDALTAAATGGHIRMGLAAVLV